MRYLSSYKELRLYRNKQFLIEAPNKSRPKLGIKFTVLTDDREDIYWFFNSGMIYNLYNHAIFVEKRFRYKLINGASINVINTSIQDIYKKHKAKMPYMTFSFLNLGQYMQKNVIYDATDYLKILEERKFASAHMFKKQAYAIMDQIHKDERFPSLGYNRKVYFVKIDKSIKIDNTYINKPNIHSFNQALFYRLFKEPETMRDYIGSTFIIRNTTGLFTYFTLTPEYLTKGFPRLWRFLKGMWAYANADVEGIKEIQDEIDKESDIPGKEDDDEGILGKLNKITARFVGKGLSHLSKRTIGSKIIDKIEGDVDDVRTVSDASGIDDAIDALKSAGDKIDKTLDSSSYKDNGDNSRYYSDSDSGDLDSALSELDSKLSGIEDDEDEIFKDELDELDAKDDEEEKKAEQELVKKQDTEEAKKTAKEVVKAIKLTQTAKSPEQLKRIETLQKKLPNVKFGDDDITIGEMLKDYDEVKFDNPSLPVKTKNSSIKTPTLLNMTRSYYKDVLDKDIMAIAKKLADNPEIKLFLTDVKKKDISTTQDAMFEYTMKFTDEYGKNHTIVYNVPKLVDNKFFLLGGVKKTMNTQVVPMPIVKSGENLVQFSTAHNKMDIIRRGRVFDAKTRALIKLCEKLGGKRDYGILVEAGNSFENNVKYETTLEYNEISKSVYSIKISGKNKTILFHFDQKYIRRIIEDLGLDYVEKAGRIPIGIDNNKVIIYVDAVTAKDYENKKYTIADMIFSAIDQYSSFPDLKGYIKKISAPSTYMYTEMNFISRPISVGVFMGFLWGLSSILKKSGVKYKVIQKDAFKDYPFDVLKENMIEFKDTVLVYDLHPLRYSMILNGIAAQMFTQGFNIADLDGQEVYLDTFYELFKTKQMAKGYLNAKYWMMDPMTVKVQQQLGQPTDFFGCMLYINALLEDNHIQDIKNYEVCRMRNLELIPTYMYKSLVEAYAKYKYRAGRNNTSMTVKKTEIIEKLENSRLFNEYDTVNPIRELESAGTLTTKGPGGLNKDDAYSLERRAYDRSMLGVAAASSPEGGTIGIVRYSSVNPRIVNNLGFIKSGNEDSDELQMGNIGSPAELLTPFAIDHDDPKRLGMVTKESKHIMPAHHTDPLLIGNGMEKVFPYMVSNDFITIAKNDGVVIDMDAKAGIAIVQYKDGSKETIDIKTRPHYDGGMGFYILSEKEFPYKVGDKFKKNDVLVKNPSFFSTTNGVSEPEYNPGTLARVGVLMSSKTFEDSSIITDALAEKMSADVVFCKSVVLGAKAKVEEFLKIGDSFEVGDPLMIFEDELDNDEINQLVQNSDLMNYDLGGLDTIVKHTPKAKVSGVVQDIKVFYTVPYSEMSESVRKLCNYYDSNIRARKKMIEKHGAANPNEVLTDYIGVTKPTSGGKIMGEYCPVGKVLVQIYQKYVDPPSNGDKVVFYASMKTTVQERLPPELAPYPVGKKDHPIDALLSPISINARMVTSILLALYGNKLVIGLKDKIREIFNKYATNEKIQAPLEYVSKLEPGTTNEDVSLENALRHLGFTYKEIEESGVLDE